MLAERIGVSASTASESIRKLADQGLVDHEKYGAVTLTDAGREAALAMVRRHRLMETFLVNELGYGWDEVHDEAEVLEHAVSDRMLDRIDAKLGYPTRDPHGDPIPAADGQVPTPPARQLSVCRGRRRRDGRPDLRRRPGDAALLRQRRHQPGFPAAGAGPPRLRRHDLGGRSKSADAGRDANWAADRAIWEALRREAIWVVSASVSRCELTRERRRAHARPPTVGARVAVVAQQRDDPSVGRRRRVDAVDARGLQRPAVPGGFGLLRGEIAARKRQQARLVEGVAQPRLLGELVEGARLRPARTGRRGCAAAR